MARDGYYWYGGGYSYGEAKLVAESLRKRGFKAYVEKDPSFMSNQNSVYLRPRDGDYSDKKDYFVIPKEEARVVKLKGEEE
jgi:hypothetical protein